MVLDLHPWRNKHLLLFNLVNQAIFLFSKSKGAQAIVISFAGYSSLIPILTGKIYRIKTLLILHGTDCASIPSLNYGSLRKTVLKWFVGWSLKNASELLPVSSSLVASENSYLEIGKQGFTNHFDTVKTPYTVVHNGFDVDFWNYERDAERKIEFITVFSANQFFLKGGDLILQVAKQCPDKQFQIAGCEWHEQWGTRPENVKFLGKLSQEILRSRFQESKVYLQLSVFEGFGCSLAEAMLCGCYPVVSNANILPEIVGDTGKIVQKKDVNELKSALNQALLEDVGASESNRCRERIISAYPLKKRIDILHERISKR